MKIRLGEHVVGKVKSLKLGSLDYGETFSFTLENGEEGVINGARDGGFIVCVGEYCEFHSPADLIIEADT